jgi:hypothetical protein
MFNPNKSAIITPYRRGYSMTVRKTIRKVNKARILKAVASSSAIETGESIKQTESRLKANTSKFKYLELAN